MEMDNDNSKDNMDISASEGVEALNNDENIKKKKKPKSVWMKPKQN